MKWVDEDSFDVTVEPTGVFSLALTSSDLSFQSSGGDAVDISGASFNHGESDYSTYFAGPDNPTGPPRPTDPDVSLTATSVTVACGDDWSGQLSNDGPTLRFDVQTENPGAPVPDGGSTLIMLFSALGVVFVGARSRFKQAS